MLDAVIFQGIDLYDSLRLLSALEHSATNGPAHTSTRAWHKLEIQRGKMGMTWGIKLQRFAIAFAVVAALAAASGAFWVESFSDWFGW
jgi:hypothetical protein